MEVDCRVAYHSELPSPSNLVVRANDTDILVGLLANQGRLPRISIWMELGLFTTNNLRYVVSLLLANNLGNRLCDSSGFSCLHRLQLHLYKGESAQKALAKLGEREIVDEECIKELYVWK